MAEEGDEGGDGAGGVGVFRDTFAEGVWEGFGETGDCVGPEGVDFDVVPRIWASVSGAFQGNFKGQLT